MEGIYSKLRIVRRHITGEPILSYAEVCHAIKEIRQTNCGIILGGDVLNSSYEYLYANWYYTSEKNIPWETRVQQSCEKAAEYVNKIKDKESLFYILVVQEKNM